MAFRVEEFISQLNHKGVSHKSDFEVIISIPSKLQPLISTRELALRANRADLPGRSIQTTPARHTIGPERQIAYNVSHVPVSMTFIADAGMNIKKTLEAWQDLAIGKFRDPRQQRTSGVYNIGYYEDYIGTIEITQFERPERQVYKTKLLEVYPLTINPLDVDWSSDNIHELNVTWNYRYYEVLDLPSDISGTPTLTTNPLNTINRVADSINRGIGQLPTLF